MPHLDEQEWKNRIIAKRDERDTAAERQAEIADELAQLIVSAKADKIPHGKIAEDWLGITRDGLTKYLNRHTKGK